MENKKLICRHCKGDHLSIQCPTKTKIITKNNYQSKTLVIFKNLPDDITPKELFCLLEQWKPIGKINVKSIKSNKSNKYTKEATIEFLDPKMADKVVYQLDKTTFDHFIIEVSKYKLS